MKQIHFLVAKNSDNVMWMTSFIAGDESDDDENDVPGNNEFNNYVVWIYLFLPFT